MKNILIFISVLFYFHLSQAQPVAGEIPSPLIDLQSQEEIKAAEEAIQEKFGDIESETPGLTNLSVLVKYNHIDPNGLVPTDLLAKALQYFDLYGNRFANQDYITVVDFSPHSKYARFFVIDMKGGSVWDLRTTHGSGGDSNNNGYVDSVSNRPGSHQSSKGFYQVSEIYYGKYGRSIRMDGLSSSNSNVRRRAIVIHGADYVYEAPIKQGRSWGCFALAWSVKDKAVDKIAGGSLLYADFSTN